MSHWSDGLSRADADRMLTLLEEAKAELATAASKGAREIIRDIERLFCDLGVEEEGEE